MTVFRNLSTGLLTLIFFTLGIPTEYGTSYRFACVRAQEAISDQNFIRIDQFGYLANATKVAVIARAERGYNEGKGINLNPGVRVRLIDNATGAIVFRKSADHWNGGSTDGLSGDRGYWFDFSEFTTPGDYHIQVTQLDGTTVDSYDFRIGPDAYDDVLRAAVNFFYYQRFNQEKPAEYASGAPWTDAAWFDRPDQEYAVRKLDDPGTTRDLHGGWFDAGDPNKYVTFAVDAVHNLLSAYELAPMFWDTFDLNIPESDNEVADLLDEIRFEIDWIKRMQLYFPDVNEAGIIQKMGILNDVGYVSPPSTDTRARYYNGVCVSSSITGAGMLAHAALAYQRAGVWPEEVAELTDRAVKAWNYYENAPNKTERCDDGRIEAGDADGPGDQYAIEHLALAAAAAVYLYELTGDEKYNTFVADNYTRTRPWVAADWGVYRAHQSEAMMAYTRNPNANAQAVQQILEKKTSSEKSEGSNYKVAEDENIYRARAFYFNWGSNSLISRQVADIMDFYVYDLKEENHPAYAERAQSIINYLHGTNPSGTCFLSNMYQYGGDLCADEMWHSWFGLNTPFDNIDNGNLGPAPGFLSGGPNPQGQTSMPIKLGTHYFAGQTTGNQPPQKAFSVDNDWRNGPWAYNEPAIYYQAAYVKALSYFVTGNSPQATTDGGMGAANDCFQAEDIFATVGDGGPVDAPGAIDGIALSIPDANSTGLILDVAEGGRYDIALRVRTGTADSDGTELTGNYTIAVGADVFEYVFDPTSLAAPINGFAWGEVVLVNVLLPAGLTTVQVTANSADLLVDGICLRDPNSVPEPPVDGEAACYEAETGFTAAADVGTNSAVRADDFTPGANNGSYINLFDLGDRASYTFTLPQSGPTTLRFRVRVGEATGTDRNLADKYIIKVDGEELSTALDDATISQLFDDTYWGEIVATNFPLALGDHTLSIEANRDWLKFDTYCLQQASSGLFSPAPVRAAELTVSPNPNDGRFQLSIATDAPLRDLRVSFVNLFGQEVARTQATLSQVPHSVGMPATGREQQSLDLDYRGLGLPAGVYLVTVSEGIHQLGRAQRVVIR